jgi:hypothetical protein
MCPVDTSRWLSLRQTADLIAAVQYCRWILYTDRDNYFWAEGFFHGLTNIVIKTAKYRNISKSAKGLQLMQLSTDF